MAKVMTENRELCEIKCEPYKKMIKEATDRETQVLESIKKTPAGVEYQKLNLCDEMIGVATYYIQINALTVELVNTKDNEALNNARKMLYKAIIYLEEVVSNVVDALQSDMEEKLASISNASVEKRFYLIRKLGLCIDILIEAFGDNSKWKESFVELQGRFATVAKNLLDLKKATKDYFDPNSPDYETSVLYIRLIRKLYDQSATAYRDRYELATHRIDDMRIAILFLSGARRVAIALGEAEEAEEIKKKAGVWKQKVEADQKRGVAK
ncbi:MULTISPECIES: hypothetical protein [unclassified Treponema]|jgi:hypothetical protein|uniref:hypothetical protein n=1 Tax=unclassified Treponema TaxID=2638727 RepID=UPI0025E717B0|nr:MULTISPECIES: hypothetical protein [unclassified Treponema]MBQ8679007.1 hypothetical protein [Treponema sp.]